MLCTEMDRYRTWRGQQLLRSADNDYRKVNMNRSLLKTNCLWTVYRHTIVSYIYRIHIVQNILTLTRCSYLMTYDDLFTSTAGTKFVWPSYRPLSAHAHWPISVVTSSAGVVKGKLIDALSVFDRSKLDFTVSPFNKLSGKLPWWINSVCIV